MRSRRGVYRPRTPRCASCVGTSDTEDVIHIARSPTSAARKAGPLGDLRGGEELKPSDRQTVTGNGDAGPTKTRVQVAEDELSADPLGDT